MRGSRIHPPMLGRPRRNVCASLGLALPRLVGFTPREEAIEVPRADVEVTIRGSERDPLDQLGSGRARSAYLHRVNLGGAFPPIPVGLVSQLFLLRRLSVRGL